MTDLARAFWRRQDPIGKLFPLPSGGIPIVGVAHDVSPLRFGGSDNPAVYRLRQTHPWRNWMAVRFENGASSGVVSVRRALREVDPNLVVIAMVLQTWIDQITSVLWNLVSLIVILGAVAAVLATTGIYGAVSFAVSQRTRELGIRVALGASRIDIVREVLWSGGKPVIHGLLAGAWLSIATAAGLRQSFQGTKIRLDSSDPWLYLLTALVLIGAALAAMAIPAHRGAKSDPLDALRCE